MSYSLAWRVANIYSFQLDTDMWYYSYLGTTDKMRANQNFVANLT